MTDPQTKEGAGPHLELRNYPRRREGGRGKRELREIKGVRYFVGGDHHNSISAKGLSATRE
jgi:hypothetical protein